MIIPSALSMRQKPPPGSRVARPVAGGLWLPGMHGGVSDAAGCNAPGVVIGGVSQVQGPFGGPALKFDNATGYVDCGLSGNNAFNWSNAVPFGRTFWAWVRRPSSSSVGPIFAKGSNSSNSGWNLSVTTTGLLAGWVGSTNKHITTSTVLSVDAWHLVVITWSAVPINSNAHCVIYLDGKPEAGGGAPSGTQNASDTFNLWIGHAQYVSGTGGAQSAWADLEIDHWGLDHRFYSQEEITDLYARPFRNFMQPGYFRKAIYAGASGARPQVMVCT